MDQSKNTTAEVPASIRESGVKRKVGCILEDSNYLVNLFPVFDEDFATTSKKLKTELVEKNQAEEDHLIRYSSDDEDIMSSRVVSQDSDSDPGTIDCFKSEAGVTGFEDDLDFFSTIEDTVLSEEFNPLFDFEGQVSDFEGLMNNATSTLDSSVNLELTSSSLTPLVEDASVVVDSTSSEMVLGVLPADTTTCSEENSSAGEQKEEEEEPVCVTHIHELVKGLKGNGPGSNGMEILDNMRPQRTAESFLGGPRLAVGPEPQQTFFKEEGGSFLYCGVDIHGGIMDQHLNPAKTAENLKTNSVPLDCSLVFEDGRPVPAQDQRFLQIANPGGVARLRLGELRGIIQFRIKQVSNNMGGRRVKLKIAVKDCPGIAPVFTVPIEVKSKRKTLSAAVRNEMTCNDLKLLWSNWAVSVNAAGKGN